MKTSGSLISSRSLLSVLAVCFGLSLLLPQIVCGADPMASNFSGDKLVTPVKIKVLQMRKHRVTGGGGDMDIIANTIGKPTVTDITGEILSMSAITPEQEKKFPLIVKYLRDNAKELQIELSAGSIQVGRALVYYCGFMGNLKKEYADKVTLECEISAFNDPVNPSRIRVQTFLQNKNLKVGR